ncbi:histidine kinase [Ichthyenterobacterium sp. W332]|uniref:Histidine kinase n=1 Tax=Microcosmobacter mediterraneus TaxID=3075607 RepID=A0ABU2YLY2_9FLAO|nr:2TM domain-containing protein [Ichthyenterobacterium sp. W332]MDT0559158.1 histidine kinase [Ichthyenterobacterium sp. W332]
MKKLLKTIISGVLIGIVIMLVDQVIRYFTGSRIELNNNFLRILAYYMLYSIPLSLVNSYFFDYINEYVVWDRYKKYRIAIGFFGSVAITLVTIFFIRAFIETVIEGETWDEFVNTERPEFYLSALMITLIISLFFHAVYYYKEAQKNKIKEQKVIAGTASAKFDALKNQLDPHFLFNSLNVLTSLIEENPDNAQKFTTSLSKVYRYVLEQKNKDLVTVDEELDFARTYMSLLKMRFEDSLIFDIPEKAQNPESKVVPLSLQLLLENAVKHNMVTSSKPLHIKIYEEGNNLVVMNNLQPKQIVKKSSGVGLGNIKQRYELLTNKKVIINQEAKRFAVAIPMLTKQIKVMRRIESKNEFDDRYVRARKHVEEVKEFYYSVISYCIVIPFLIFINWYTSWNFKWFWFPMFGWGIGIAFHAYKVYVNDGMLGRNWEQRKIEQYMQEEENKNRWN